MNYYTIEEKDEGRCEMREAMIDERKERKWKIENECYNVKNIQRKRENYGELCMTLTG